MTNTVSNPQSRMELLALAERVEKATDNDAELFYDVFREALPKPETIWAIPHETWTDEYSEWQQRQTRFYELVEVGAFIDAAMTLLPGPDWEYSIEWQAGTLLWVPEASMVAIVKIGDPKLMMEAEAATPALALVAACLRSIAAKNE